MSIISIEYPSNCQIFGNQYYEKTKQRKQPPKLQHHQTESAKVRNRVWFRTGPNSKSTNQERPQNISILCKHIIPDTHSHTLPENWKLAKWCAKWRIKLNPEKTKVIIFSWSSLARNSEPTLKLYGEKLKIYPQVKFLGITFDFKFTFKKHFEDILGRCNARYQRIRLLTNKKWGPSPSTILQIYKQCLRPIFEYGSLSTITTSDTIISEIQRLQKNLYGLPCVYQHTSA